MIILATYVIVMGELSRHSEQSLQWLWFVAPNNSSFLWFIGVFFVFYNILA